MSRGAARQIATVFGVGLLPFAPGTWASLLGALLAMAAHAVSREHYVVACIALCVLAAWSAHVAETALGMHDDSRIVIDELVGMLAALALLDRTNLVLVAAALALFRFLDIVKPWPIRWLDRRVRGGVGVVLDDVVAGAAVAGLSLFVG